MGCTSIVKLEVVQSQANVTEWLKVVPKVISKLKKTMCNKWYYHQDVRLKSYKRCDTFQGAKRRLLVTQRNSNSYRINTAFSDSDPSLSNPRLLNFNYVCTANLHLMVSSLDGWL
ncbi:hypothetical protein TNCV_4818011 [Trichonephila clavipes]|nr:hypothetical protein TNCV_4818011 [Trichonephila clavipes]